MYARNRATLFSQAGADCYLDNQNTHVVMPTTWESAQYARVLSFKTLVVEQSNKCFDAATQSFTVNDHQATVIYYCRSLSYACAAACR